MDQWPIFSLFTFYFVFVFCNLYFQFKKWYIFPQSEAVFVLMFLLQQLQLLQVKLPWNAVLLQIVIPCSDVAVIATKQISHFSPRNIYALLFIKAMFSKVRFSIKVSLVKTIRQAPHRVNIHKCIIITKCLSQKYWVTDQGGWQQQ